MHFATNQLRPQTRKLTRNVLSASLPWLQSLLFATLKLILFVDRCFKTSPFEGTIAVRMHKWFLYWKHFQILQVRDSHSKLHATSCPVGLSMCTVVWAVLPGSKVPHDEPSLQTYGALISWSRISRLHQFVWCCKPCALLCPIEMCWKTI